MNEEATPNEEAKHQFDSFSDAFGQASCDAKEKARQVKATLKVIA